MQSRSKKSLLLLAAGVLLLMSPGQAGMVFPVLAGNRQVFASQNESMNFNLEGTISKLDAGKLTLSTEENIIFHVSYDDKTEIKHQDGSPASAKELRVKVKLRVEGDLTESGEILARRIVIQKEPGSKPPPPK